MTKVWFKLMNCTDTSRTYHYYPDCDESKEYGIIVFEEGLFRLEKLAPDDVIYKFGIEEFCEKSNLFGQLYELPLFYEGKHQYLPDIRKLTDEEMEKGCVYLTKYADCVMEKLYRDNKSGRILSQGTAGYQD